MGKLFKSKNEFTLGYWERDELILEFDIDNLDTNLYT